MIQHPSFVVEPWRIRETALDLDVLAQSESIFALSNGHLGLRGNLDGELQTHERVLDLRAGTLERRVEWISPAGGAVRVSSVRLVSLTQRSIAAISYEVEPLRAAARLVVQSELVANEP